MQNIQSCVNRKFYWKRAVRWSWKCVKIWRMSKKRIIWWNSIRNDFELHLWVKCFERSVFFDKSYRPSQTKLQLHLWLKMICNLFMLSEYFHNMIWIIFIMCAFFVHLLMSIISLIVAVADAVAVAFAVVHPEHCWLKICLNTNTLCVQWMAH